MQINGSGKNFEENVSVNLCLVASDLEPDPPTIFKSGLRHVERPFYCLAQLKLYNIRLTCFLRDDVNVIPLFLLPTFEWKNRDRKLGKI